MDKQEILKNIEDICNSKEISISKLQRFFVIGFPRGARIMDSLIEKKIVERVEYRYNILDTKALKDFLITTFINN